MKNHGNLHVEKMLPKVSKLIPKVAKNHQKSFQNEASKQYTKISSDKTEFLIPETLLVEVLAAAGASSSTSELNKQSCKFEVQSDPKITPKII